MGGSSSAGADRIGNDSEEEIVQWTILLASTFRWMRPTFAFSTGKARSFARARQYRPQAIADELVKAPSCSRIVFEQVEWRRSYFMGCASSDFPLSASRAAGLSGAQVAFYPQDRSQRRAGTGAFGPHWLLQAGACEVAAGPRGPLAHHRAQEAGGPASNLGKSDPRFGGRVRSPAPAGSHLRLHQRGSQSKRWDRGPFPRHARFDCGSDCRDGGGRRDRRRHKTHDESLGSLPPAHDHPRRRPTDRAGLRSRSR